MVWYCMCFFFLRDGCNLCLKLIRRRCAAHGLRSRRRGLRPVSGSTPCGRSGKTGMVTANVVRMYIVLWTTRRSTWSQPKSGWLSFKIGWPPMVWLVGQICWWRQRTEEREGGNTSGSCLAGPACQSGNCLAGSAGQFVGSASQMSNSMASHTKYFKSVQNWIDSLYGPFFELAHTCANFPI